MTQTTTTTTAAGFRELDLPAPLLKALEALGYESPTAIQISTIPPMLEGCDVLGHAPTGTGKTAAFALPTLARLKPGKNGVQALVLAPTRELAIQVAEAFSQYASQMSGVRVLPIYGGQEYGRQTRALKQGVDIVVGTPGRIMDHMRRGTLDLSSLDTLVLDEADEMLRMGFIDDVKWILEQAPANRRMALFSATMPKEVKRIAKQHMTNPTEVAIEKRTMQAETIRQRYWSVSGYHKLDTLTRILEAEEFDGMIVFVRTKNATVEVAERLQARGYRAAAMSGDIAQAQREKTVGMLKSNRLDILVATDVVARGLDVERISHVVNYDVPYDAEAYVHRIGRTGRAGRHGDAILFITPREQRMLGVLERATGRKIEKLVLPTTKMINDRRVANFKQSILDTLATGELAYLQQLMEEMVLEHNVPATRVAAALAKQMHGDTGLLLDESRDSKPSRQKSRDLSDPSRTGSDKRDSRGKRHERDDRTPRTAADSRSGTRAEKRERKHGDKHAQRASEKSSARAPERQRDNRHVDSDIEMEAFRVAVGDTHGVQASNLVGAIANEAGLDAEFIGRIRIFDDYSTVELPTGMPKAVLKDLRKVWVCSRQLNMSRAGGDESEGSSDAEAGSKKAKSADKPNHKRKEFSTSKPKARGAKKPRDMAGKKAPKRVKKRKKVETS